MVRLGWIGAAMLGMAVMTFLGGCTSNDDGEPVGMDGTAAAGDDVDAATNTGAALSSTTAVAALAVSTPDGSAATVEQSSTTTSESSSTSGSEATSSTVKNEATSSTTTTNGVTSSTSSGTGATTATTAAPNPSSAPPRSSTSKPTGTSTRCGAGVTHCVGPGQQHATLTAAVASASNGSVIELLAGRYNETVAVDVDNVTIRSQAGAKAVVDCSGIRPAKGKACILAVGTNLTVENLEVTGARGPDNNEACFRNEPGTRFVVRGVTCHGSNNGILGSGGSWLIENSLFYNNGAGDGQSHNLYLSGDCSEVMFRNSRSYGSVGGHAFKSRCRTSTIDGSELVDNAVADAAEFSNGGKVTIRNSDISQPDGANGNIVRHGAEGCKHSGTLTFVGSTIRSARTPGYIRSECGPVTLTDTPLPSGISVVGP